MGDGLGSVSLVEAWVPSCPGLLGSTIFTHTQLSGPFCPGTLTDTPQLDRYCEDSLNR